MSFIEPTIEIDSDQLAQDAYDSIQTEFSNWSPAEGSYEAFLIEAVSQIVSTLTTIAQDVPASIFRYFGSLVGIVPDAASYASVDATFTAVDTSGYEIPSGVPVGVIASGSSTLAFATVGTTTIPVGSTTATVSLQAVGTGSAYSGIGSLGVSRLDSLAYISSISLNGITAGGDDAETDPDYLDRLTSQLRLMAPRPLEPEEFAQFAMTVDGVYRCLALNTYDPVTRTYNNAGYLTLVPIDEFGQAVSTPIATEVQDLLDTNRVLNLTLSIIRPTDTRITIDYVGVARSGYDPAAVESEADAAVLSFLSRATWGARQDPRTWIDDQLMVRIQDIGTVLNNVEGFDYYTSLRINGGTVDVRMTGPAALPSADSTVSGSVTAP